MEEKILQGLPFWKALDETQKLTAQRCAQIRHYDKGAVIHSKDNECLGIIKLVSGHARAFMLSEEGREITLYRLSAGDTDVLSASCVVSQIKFETQLIAEEDCEVFVLPAVCVADLKDKNLPLRCFIYEQLGERFSDVMVVMQQMLFTRLDARIASCLLGELGSAQRSVVKLTHEEIASRINSSREVVSRTLKEMAEEGLVAVGRGQVEILDREGLKLLIS